MTSPGGNQIVSAAAFDQSSSRQTADSGSSTTQASATTSNAPIQTCVPATNIVPSALDTSGTTGLKQQIDSPIFYQIYGNDDDTIRSQIRHCAPKSDGSDAAEYVAQTMYQLTWRYNIQVAPSGVCKVTDASVGLHVNQVMPRWQPTKDARAGLSGQWDAFMDALTTHENGHTNIDVRYAQQLLDDLNNFPPTPCDQLSQAVKRLTDADVAELQQANDSYDSSTNHGATQGAILP